MRGLLQGGRPVLWMLNQSRLCSTDHNRGKFTFQEENLVYREISNFSLDSFVSIATPSIPAAGPQLCLGLQAEHSGSKRMLLHSCPG